MAGLASVLGNVHQKQIRKVYGFNTDARFSFSLPFIACTRPMLAKKHTNIWGETRRKWKFGWKYVSVKMKERHKEITIKRDSKMIIYINLVQRKYESFIHIFKTENVLTFFYHKCMCVCLWLWACVVWRQQLKLNFDVDLTSKSAMNHQTFILIIMTPKWNILQERNIHSRKTCRSKHIFNEAHNEFVMRIIQSGIIRLSVGMFRESRLVDLK